MPVYPEPPETIELAGEPYPTFERPDGAGRMWEAAQVTAQPGDVGIPKPFPLEFHGGFGFSRKYTGADGQRVGASHHAYAQNVNVHHKNIIGNSPEITYLNLNPGTQGQGAPGFRLGGYTNSQLGSGFQSTDSQWYPITSYRTEANGGTVTWDGDNETDGSAGQTHRLIGELAAADRVPAGATMSGVRVRRTRQAIARAAAATSATLVGTGENDNAIGTVAWTDPTDIETEDDVTLAQATGSGGAVSNYLVARNFGFALPATAEDIEVTVDVRRQRGPALDGTVRDHTVQLRDAAGALAGDNKSAAALWSPSIGTVQFGGDDWNAGLAYTDVNHANFGVAMAVTLTANPFSGFDALASVAWVKITVSYTIPAEIDDIEVSLAIAGTVTGDDKAAAGDWPATATVETNGGVADLWSTAMTVSQANGVVGFSVAAQIVGGAAALTSYEMSFTYITPVSGVGQLGGGIYTEVPQHIREYGARGVYVHCGSRTYVVDAEADPPAVVEVKSHGSGARARSSDVFDNQLVVPLDVGEDLAVATSPYTTSSPTQWATASGVKMQRARVGSAGRLYTSRENLVFNVQPGLAPTSSANYVPSAGEVITDETDPVRSLEEYLGGLVAGTTQTLRTIDPDGGFQGVQLLPKTRVSATAYAGRALIAVGSDLYFFTQRAGWLFRPGQPPQHIGFELMEQNETPYRLGVPGVPDYDGDWIYVPYYFTDTGDSVIFALHLRPPGDPGVGPVVMNDFLYLQGRECRAVRYWGGSTTRLFFGAGTDEFPESVGYIDMCDAPGSLFFRPHIGDPAAVGTLYGGLDDFGTPGVPKGVDRIDLPIVQNADASNHVAVAVSPDGVTWTTLGTVVTDGHAVLRWTGTATLAGTEIGTRWVITNPDSDYVLVRGLPTIYLFEMPEMVEQVTTLLDLATTQREDAEAKRARVAALVEAGPVNVKYLERDVVARILPPSLVEYADRGGHVSYALRLMWREVEVA